MSVIAPRLPRQETRHQAVCSRGWWEISRQIELSHFGCEDASSTEEAFEDYDFVVTHVEMQWTCCLGSSLLR